MALVKLDGGFIVPIGPGYSSQLSNVGHNSTTLDAAAEAVIFIGQIFTSDEGSHTINTTGSSSLGWRSTGVTFANAGTTVKVGLAAVDLANGPPGRAVNVTDVITFDVSKSMTGGGGGVTANAWQTHVPDTGTKTVAHGDFIAFAVQMTARGGSDTVQVAHHASTLTKTRPIVTEFVGAAYAAVASVPDCVITFSDGALGWFYGGEVSSVATNRTFNSSQATKEYGQLFKLPFPTRIYGLYGWLDPDADSEMILYSDPLGATPVAEKTVSIDANAVQGASVRRVDVLFSSPYSTTADQVIGAVYKPGASSITTYYKTLASATHRITDPWGVDGYGISRASGAFADANSSLDHYYIGLLCGAFDNGGGGAAVNIINSRATAHARR